MTAVNTAKKSCLVILGITAISRISPQIGAGIVIATAPEQVDRVQVTPRGRSSSGKCDQSQKWCSDIAIIGIVFCTSVPVTRGQLAGLAEAG